MNDAALLALLLVPRRTRPLDLAALPALVMGADLIKKHKIDEFENSVIACRCGWHYREHRPDAYGPAALKDQLLDRYNAHRAARVQSGREAGYDTA